METSARTAPRILIVEDELLVAMDVEGQLSSFGYEIAGTADSGPLALQLAKATEPDLILMDISLRGAMDGIDLAVELQRCGNQATIIFVTAYGSGKAQTRVEAVCFSGYLIKPYRPQELRDIVQKALRDQSENRPRSDPLPWKETV